MWSPFQSRDLPALLAGAAVATAAGLMLGATLHPDLGEEAPLAPQTLVAGGGAREAPGGGDPGLGRYAGPIPEYVTGTDATRPPAEFVQALVDAPQIPPEAVEPAPEMRVRPEPAAWREPPEPPIDYPSRSGGVVYETDLPPPPQPPGDDAPG